MSRSTSPILKAESAYEKLVGRHVNSLERNIREAAGLPTSPRKFANADLYKQTEEELDKTFGAIDYRVILSQMNTGDVLMTHGTEAMSMAIKLTTRSWYSHVSLVVRNPDASILKLYGITTPDPDGLYVLESEPHTADGRDGGGVQLNSLNEWMVGTKKYYLEKVKTRFFVTWRGLRFEGGQHPRAVADVPGLPEMMRDAHGRSYETQRRALIGSLFHANRTEDLSTVFCSELVAWAYKAMGLLPATENASNWTPIQFSAMYQGDKINSLMAGKAQLCSDRRMKVEDASKSR